MKQEDVIRFYEGDVKGNDPFYADAKAYVTWNALLFPGMESEKARSEENRYFNPAFFDHIPEVIDMSVQLIKCMSKASDDLHVYRVERFVDYACFMKEKRISSFLSTSTAGFLNAYQDKKQLVLMDITIPKGCLCADFSMLLNAYKKREEKEILLPPYLSFDCHVLEQPLEIQKITDGEGNPVKIYCHMDMKGFDFPALNVCESVSEAHIQASKRVYAALNQKRVCEKEDIEKYLALKKWIQKEIIRHINNY